MNKYDSPCKDCNDRVLGCHSTCTKYKEFKEFRNKVSKARLEYKTICEGAYVSRVRSFTNK